MIIAVAMLPFSVSAEWSTDTYTTTINGLTWTYKVDTEAKKVFLGGGTASGDKELMVPADTTGVLYIPDTLVHDGETYLVTDYGYAALSGCIKLTGVVFPETTFAQTANGAALFQKMTGCVAIWWKGPATVASGTQPISKIGGATQLFRYDNKLTAVVLGPNVTYSYLKSAYPFFKDTSCNVKVFIPKAHWTDASDNDFIDATSTGTYKIIRYGPGEDIDVSIDGTFTVATAERLEDVLSVANDLHTYCGMNPKINVTNVIEVADVSITAEKLAFLDNGTFNSLVFKVNTQAQLDTLLAAIPSSVPFAINPADSKEQLTVPQGREVYVKLSAQGRNGRYTPKINGLSITFH
jgi:hypothetical protein